MMFFRLGVIPIALAATVPVASAAWSDVHAVNSAIVRTTVCADRYPDLAADIAAALGDYESRASSKISDFDRKDGIQTARSPILKTLHENMLRVRSRTKDVTDIRVLCGNLPGELRSRSPAQDAKEMEAQAKIARNAARNKPKSPVDLATRQQRTAEKRLSEMGIQISFPSSLMVTWVRPDSPAAKAGLMAGDLVIRVNGLWVKDHAELAAALAKTPLFGVPDFAVERLAMPKTAETPPR